MGRSKRQRQRVRFELAALQRRRLLRWLDEIGRQGGWASLAELAAWADLTPTALGARLAPVRRLGVWLPHVGGPEPAQDRPGDGRGRGRPQRGRGGPARCGRPPASAHPGAGRAAGGLWLAAATEAAAGPMAALEAELAGQFGFSAVSARERRQWLAEVAGQL